MEEFILDGKLVLGICNGFQALVKSRYLPGLDGETQEATLSFNDSGRFEDRWVYLRRDGDDSCVFTQGMEDVIYLPVAHSEGSSCQRMRRLSESLRRTIKQFSGMLMPVGILLDILTIRTAPSAMSPGSVTQQGRYSDSCPILKGTFCQLSIPGGRDGTQRRSLMASPSLEMESSGCLRTFKLWVETPEILKFRGLSFSLVERGVLEVRG